MRITGFTSRVVTIPTDPVVSHLIPEIHVHLIAPIPNGLTVEYMPWSQALWADVPRIESGNLVVADKPGLGLEFDRATVPA